MQLAMTAPEATLFESFVRCATNYLEFGSGGSTYCAAQHVKRRVISVDSSDKWLTDVRAAVSKLTEAPELVLHHADIGKTKEWGYPVDESRKPSWALYSTDVWSISGAERSDLYLIDGRFRVSCFAETIVRAPMGAFVMIHDFADRPHYHIIKQFAACVAQIEKLSVFIKDGRTHIGAAKMIANEFRFDPA